MKKLDMSAGGETIDQAQNRPSASETQEQVTPKHGFPPPEVREARLRRPVVATWNLGGSDVPHRKGEAAELRQVEAYHWNPAELQQWEIDAVINKAKPGIAQ